jgi:hypothetical protein
MTDEECRNLGIMTDAELKEFDERLNQQQIVGLADLVKYFDRINDKLFQLNNMVIAGYFALIVIQPQTSSWLILIPIVNFFFLLYVDYQMMEKSRLESNLRSLSVDERQTHARLIDNSTYYSLFTIVSTSIVTLVFTYLLVRN